MSPRPYPRQGGRKWVYRPILRQRRSTSNLELPLRTHVSRLTIWCLRSRDYFRIMESRELINAAWSDRELLKNDKYTGAVRRVIEEVDKGRLRVASPTE